MKKSILALGILIAGLAAWVYVSPRLAAKHLQDAARTGDVAALNELVDFPLVREQLKADLKAGLLESSAKRDSANPFATVHRHRRVAALAADSRHRGRFSTDVRAP